MCLPEPFPSGFSSLSSSFSPLLLCLPALSFLLLVRIVAMLLYPFPPSPPSSSLASHAGAYLSFAQIPL